MLRPRRLRRFAFLLTLAALLGGGAAAQAQPILFGSSDDPREQFQEFWWQRRNTVDVGAGLSLIGAHWRFGGSATTRLVTRPVTAQLSANVRTGIYGFYEPDFDEPYDALRLVDFARYNFVPETRAYARVGVLNRVRLGTGHIVDFFNAGAAWDERTIGLETAFQTDRLAVQAFSDDVLLGGVVGAGLSVRPFARPGGGIPLALGLNAATDVNTYRRAPDPLQAFNVDLSYPALSEGEIGFTPFVSYAWYGHAGRGISFGADLHSPNFIDLARFSLKMALFYNGREFIPGYIGAFYPVSNPAARIRRSEDFGKEEGPDETAGIALAQAAGGNDLLTELRLLVFNRFEFWYAFRRHYGSQSLSEYHLRLFLRAQSRGELSVGMDRGGLLGFLSLFNDLGDQTALSFDAQFRAARALRLRASARYTYERIGDGLDGTARYLVERRFEPQIGLRHSF